MDEQKKELKARKKEYKRAKRKAFGLWKALAIISAPLAVILTVITVVVGIFDNSFSIFVGGTFNNIKNKDENAVYFESDFDSKEEMVQYGLELTKQVEGEGAALLMNENNALPLEEGAKVSCFSNSSVNLVYGGTGSGNIDASTANTLKGSLENTGFEVNKTLWDFYLNDMSEYQRVTGGMIATEGAKTSEVPWNLYTDKVKESVVEYGDAAIVTFSRVGGEGADLEFEDVNYLALSEEEKEMMENVAAMKKDGAVKKIIVLINSANALQVDFLKNNEYGIDACLWIGDVGISGIDAVGEILSGKINPSGSLVDTYCYNNYSSPAMANFVPVEYEGYEEGLIPENAKTYMIYQEGIYVGYRYYETRYEDFVMGKGNAGEYNYSEDVAFPFGYGLSYTDFAYSNLSVNYNEETDEFELAVTVTNTGDTYSGKETVQVYVQSPYTEYDIENKVEKSSVALCGFGKTKILAPGESETITVNVDRRELASYDAYGAGTYILDAGDYYLTVGTDAHNAVNNILAAKGYSSADGRMDAEGNAALTYKWNNAKLDTTTYATSANGTEIKNQLADSDINLSKDLDGTEITYLSRNDWTGTFPTETLKLALTEKLAAKLQDVQYDAANYEEIEMPTLKAKNGLKLVDMIGLEFDDPKWDDLLDQLSFDDMVSLIGDSFHWTMPIESVQAPGTRDENGPQGLTASLFKAGEVEGKTAITATAFTSEDVMAATFNTELMYEIGRVIGNNCIEAEIACLYGPGNNTHRTPYGGRNFEYYSEDPFLAGVMSTHEIQAMKDKGIFVVMKHFALNDCEQDRIGLGVWLNEQSAREIYLKAFQSPVENADAGMMVAYTRWGAIWSGGNRGLMNNIVREEWGKKGLIITDNVLTTYVNGVDGLMAGGVSTYDAMLPYVTNQLPKYKKDAVIVNAMREACHHNLYSIANSAGMNGIGKDTVIKARDIAIHVTFRTAAIIFGALFVVTLVLWILKKRKFKQTEIYTSYKEYRAALKKK